MIEPPLFRIPRDTWQHEVDAILKAEPWLKDKSDRTRLIREKNDYIDRYCPDIKSGGEETIVDVGPGFGVFLELCREYGWGFVGHETAIGEGGMGNPYLRLARLWCERQDVPVKRYGFGGFLRLCLAPAGPCCRLVNFQGSFSQCHSQWLDGTPHHVHRKAEEQRWRFGPELNQTWQAEFTTIRKTLLPGGEVLIVANQTGPPKDHKTYGHAIRFAADAAGLDLVLHLSDWEHKWRKR